nr:hypothetical protein [Legionella jordanis]
MLLTIALVVLGCAIVVMFSAEFARGFKKLFNISGMKLLLPLIFASALVVYYEYWISWGLLITKWLLHQAAAYLSKLFPFMQGIGVAEVLLLWMLSTVPVLALDFWMKKQTFEPFRYPFITSLIIWLLAAILLTVSYNYS